MPITLILGGARSGKSGHAQRLAEAHGGPVVLIATAPRIEGDEEWNARIDRHRSERPEGWRTVEEPWALPRTLQTHAAPEGAVIVDCLGLWVSNLMFAGVPVEQAASDLIALLPELPGQILLVGNEVGMGLVPESPESRRYRDEVGRLHQRIAQVADQVVLVAAGLPLRLKG
ncbi:MAG: bifunctional adenosylcobinamide kinase/adenosylcobinamide-phosphate guanylyltransferase [Alphaproteobacteria bacterium CG_4_10_14_0_2_um_filter_63_37]|nr:MAG: bifunctional adenosylcobinamide kinase/adenosylcobinamide-phosphate guanylyltransferase [Proteobacteria bacterium CG1_02_64_396]PJA25542.1 MAG: bifunctional adenosylcobinamide kinase/adenosylcobinamide-phosphate guanylyltransferase [Alphaproteobacteria bacterium CG_4_10_14_0_2_um_filter_63_37]